MGTNINSNSRVATCTQRKAAAKKYVPSSGTILVRTKPYTEQQVEDVYQACIDTRANVVSLRGQLSTAVIARRQADAAMAAFDVGLKEWVNLNFGPTSQQAVDFGYAKKTPAKPDVATKAAAQVKAKATRQVRGTKGPKARRKVTAAPEAASAATPEVPPAAAPTTTPKS
jgi:hypothetical protein